MKKHLLTAALAIVAVGGVYVTKAEANSSASLATSPVYTTLTGCSIPITCSDIPANPCRENVSAYYLQPGCTNPTSAFVYEP